ncbi:MAG: hypothetical protein ACRDD7_17295 [Peptostreptococcaceae bacterium]
MAIYQIGAASAVTDPLTKKGLPTTVTVTLTEENHTLATGTITGIEGAAVELLEDDVVKAICYTDSNGLFGIPFVPTTGKTYTMRVFKPNPVA